MMSKQKIALNLLIFAGLLSVISCQILGEFQRLDYLTKYSGIVQIFSQVTPGENDTIPLTDQHIKKGVVNDYVEITNHKAQFYVEDTASIRASVDTKTNTIFFEGINGTIESTYAFKDHFGLLNESHEGNGTCYWNTSKSVLKVTYGVNKGRPNYSADIDFELKYVMANISSGNITVIEDLRDYILNNVTMIELAAAVKAQLVVFAKKWYDAKPPYDVLYVYELSPEDNVVVNVTMTNFTSSLTGIMYMMDGSVLPKKASGQLKMEVDESKGSAQYFFHKNFITLMGYVPAFDDFFEWNLTEKDIDMPDFDFRMADMWVIFPSSRGTYRPSDKLFVNCSADKNHEPLVGLDLKHQQIKVSQNLRCSVVHVEKGDVFVTVDFTVQYILDPDVEDDGKVIMKIYDTTILTSTITDCKFDEGKREKGILDGLLREGLNIYDEEQYIWGTGFQILPMRGADFMIRDEDTVVIYGQRPENATMLTSWNPRQEAI